MDNWDQQRLQAYVDNFVEESLTLEYKAADALERTSSTVVLQMVWSPF